MTAKKTLPIRDLLAQIHRQGRHWAIVDHWETDRCAIGIASQDRGRLVYISSYEKAAGAYDYECEVSVGPNPEDYETVSTGTDVPLAELVTVLEEHLRLAVS